MQQIRDYLFSDLRTNKIYPTPAHIAEEMVNALPADLWNDPTLPKKRFLDICCKSGIFLIKLRDKLMTAPAMVKAKPDEKERLKYILEDMLYGIAPCKLCEDISRIELYGKVYEHGNIVTIAANYKNYIKSFKEYEEIEIDNKKHKILRALKNIGDVFNIMKFDVVVGNPPYNSDAYLEFVLAANEVVDTDTGKICMITPAKWQAKLGVNNIRFRNEIVPYINTIVFYPNATELFDIAEVDGVCYYTVDREKKCEIKTIENKSDSIQIFNSVMQRKVNGQLNNTAYKILKNIYSSGTVKKVAVETSASHFGINSTEQIIVPNGEIEIYSGGEIVGWCSEANIGKHIQDVKKWKVMVNRMVGYSFFYDNNGKALGGNKLYIMGPNKICGFNYFCIGVCNTKEEALSIASYYNTKLVRFIILTSLTTSSIGNIEAFRFVPAPPSGKFDHIYTDEEMYRDFKILPEHINIIESIMKPREEADEIIGDDEDDTTVKKQAPDKPQITARDGEAAIVKLLANSLKDTENNK